jgi:transposase
MEVDMHFLIPLPYSRKAALELIQKHSSIGSHKNALLLGNSILYCVEDKLKIGGKIYYAYIYLDEKRRAEERDVFLKKIFEVEKKVSDITFKESKDLEDYLQDSVVGWKNIFSICSYKGKFILKRNDEGINSNLEKMGTTILISNKKINPKYTMSLYRRKDAVEKFFDSIKNDIDRNRLRIHSQEALEGKLFLDFIALIIYSYISKVMRQEQIVKDYTVQELMYEFKKIKLITLGERKTIITEVSKKQRELFEKFNINSPIKS